MSWLLSNNRLEEVCSTLTKGTFSSRLLLSNQVKGCSPSVAHSLPLPLGPALLNLSNVMLSHSRRTNDGCICMNINPRLTKPFDTVYSGVATGVARGGGQSATPDSIFFIKNDREGCRIDHLDGLGYLNSW